MVATFTHSTGPVKQEAVCEICSQKITAYTTDDLAVKELKHKCRAGGPIKDALASARTSHATLGLLGIEDELQKSNELK